MPPTPYAPPSTAAQAQTPAPMQAQTPPTRRDDRGAILLYFGIAVGAFFLLGLVLALARSVC